MKKILVSLALVASSVMAPAQAVEQKTLVVIDSYFDTRAVGATIICIPSINCSLVAKPSTSISDNSNHGDAMVEVAKKQGSVNIIALRSASTPTSDVNAGNFIDALTWVNNNSSNVGAVSFSRFFNGTTFCSPSSANTANYGGVIGADKKIRELISNLNSKGIKVFAATGNAPKKTVDYPACILDTMSVTSPGNVKDLNTDFDIDLVRTPLVGANFVGTIKWSINTYIPQTTSSATAAVAAKWVVSGGFIDKVVSVQS